MLLVCLFIQNKYINYLYLLMSNSNVLFYSTKCETCKTLFNILKSNEMMDYFTLYCVDNRPVPKLITIVPSVVSKNVNKLFVGKEVFEYVKHLLFIIKNKNIENNKKKKINGLEIGDLVGFSDNWTFVKDNKNTSTCYHQLNAKEEAIRTGPQEKPLNKQEQDKLIKQFNSERDDTIKELDQHHKLQHYEKLYGKN